MGSEQAPYPEASYGEIARSLVEQIEFSALLGQEAERRVLRVEKKMYSPHFEKNTAPSLSRDVKKLGLFASEHVEKQQRIMEKPADVLESQTKELPIDYQYREALAKKVRETQQFIREKHKFLVNVTKNIEGYDQMPYQEKNKALARELLPRLYCEYHDRQFYEEIYITESSLGVIIFTQTPEAYNKLDFRKDDSPGTQSGAHISYRKIGEPTFNAQKIETALVELPVIVIPVEKEEDGKIFISMRKYDHELRHAIDRQLATMEESRRSVLRQRGREMSLVSEDSQKSLKTEVNAYQKAGRVEERLVQTLMDPEGLYNYEDVLTEPSLDKLHKIVSRILGVEYENNKKQYEILVEEAVRAFYSTAENYENMGLSRFEASHITGKVFTGFPIQDWRFVGKMIKRYSHIKEFVERLESEKE